MVSLSLASGFRFVSYVALNQTNKSVLRRWGHVYFNNYCLLCSLSMRNFQDVGMDNCRLKFGMDRGGPQFRTHNVSVRSRRSPTLLIDVRTVVLVGRHDRNSNQRNKQQQVFVATLLLLLLLDKDDEWSNTNTNPTNCGGSQILLGCILQGKG